MISRTQPVGGQLHFLLFGLAFESVISLIDLANRGADSLVHGMAGIGAIGGDTRMRILCEELCMFTARRGIESILLPPFSFSFSFQFSVWSLEEQYGADSRTSS